MWCKLCGASHVTQHVWRKLCNAIYALQAMWLTQARSNSDSDPLARTSPGSLLRMAVSSRPSPSHLF
eukprot:5615024-Pyramimonas_sp.AAC.1